MFADVMERYGLKCSFREAGYFEIGHQRRISQELDAAIRQGGLIALCGIAGNFRALQKVHRFVEWYWRKMLSSRSRKGHIAWEVFHRIKARFPLQRPKLYLPYRELQALAEL